MLAVMRSTRGGVAVIAPLATTTTSTAAVAAAVPTVVPCRSLSARCVEVEGDTFFVESDTDGGVQGLVAGIRIEKLLHHEVTPFQNLDVFSTEPCGNMLALDGVVQITEWDEVAYSEMIAHVPLCSTVREPKDVLVVGGGDGGAVREILKYPSVESVTVCEIDEAVVRAAKNYFPRSGIAFDDPRVSVVYEDALAYVAAAQPGSYDAIVADTSDPIGPATALFEQPFYESMWSALREGGVACSQAENPWLHLEFVRDLMANARTVFGSVDYYTTPVPSYPGGLIGFMMCTKGTEKDNARAPVRGPPADGLEIYTTDMHNAAFVLPPRFAKVLGTP